MPVFSNEHEKSKWRRKLVKDNLHIVDLYFTTRVKDFLNSFFGKNGLKYK